MLNKELYIIQSGDENNIIDINKIFYHGKRSLSNKECPFHSLSTRSIFSLSKKQMSSSLKSILINYQKP